MIGEGGEKEGESDGERTWVYPLHSVGVCAIWSCAEATGCFERRGVAGGVEVVPPPAGIGHYYVSEGGGCESEEGDGEGEWRGQHL
jgi:hypothetical protein